MKVPFLIKIAHVSKNVLLFFFLFFATNTFATEKFTTHFNSVNILFTVVFSIIILVVISVLKSAILVLKKNNEHPIEGSDSSKNFSEKVIGKIVELEETKSVLFYIALIFIFMYVTYAFFKGTNYESHLLEWFNLLVRWAHVLFGIAWIGASFYFNFLENSLNRTKGLRDEIAGNLWAVHGGGFYYLEKYKIAPKEIPKDLHWFKYEAYFTWLSGFTLLIIVYYFDAKVYLIDPAVFDISSSTAIAIGIGSLIVGWLIYDTLCKSTLSKNSTIFGIILLLFISAFAYFLCHVFNSRAAYIHVGAIIGTLMVGNVFRVIIPAQKAMVHAAKEAKIVNPILGKNALLRSRHNNYFTLPVIFIMISNHFPSTYGNALNWLVLLGLSLSSVLIKHYLNVIEKGEKAVWILPFAFAGMIAMAMVTAPTTKSVCKDDSPATFTAVNEIISKRCVQCHSSNPTDDVQKKAPNGIMFDDPKNIVKYADRILQRAVITKTMPQGNKTHITQEERDVIQCWFESGANSE